MIQSIELCNCRPIQPRDISLIHILEPNFATPNQNIVGYISFSLIERTGYWILHNERIYTHSFSSANYIPYVLLQLLSFVELFTLLCHHL